MQLSRTVAQNAAEQGVVARREAGKQGKIM